MAGNPRNRISNVPFEHPQQSQLFPQYLEPITRIFCEILTKSSAKEVETALKSARIEPVPEIVEKVLKLSYGSPSAALKFFEWAGMTQKQSVYAWNLMVDLFGKNRLFEQMWDTVRGMKKEGLLAIATFVVVFENYCSVGRFNEAIMAFDTMDRYGIEPDVVAVNSLLSAICRKSIQSSRALKFFQRVKTKIPPNTDSYAILLEGWEKDTFGEMGIGVGWNPQNMPAYDALLTSLVLEALADEAIKFLQILKGKNCFLGMKFCSNALDILLKKNDSYRAVLLWDVMIGSGLVPNLIMYNAVIGLICNNNDIGNAFHFLDEMVLCGIFPDSLTYNVIFQCLIKNKKVREAGRFFYEMIKNEWPPTRSNWAAAITMFFDEYDPLMAIEIWEYMIKNHVLPLEESANALLIGLCNMGRLTELTSSAENKLDRKINIYESTMDKLKHAFH